MTLILGRRGPPLFALIDHPRQLWTPKVESYYGRMDLVFVAREMIGHCHLGPFALPLENDFEDCPYEGSSIWWTTSPMNVALYVM